MPVALVRPELLYAWKGPSLLIADIRGECGPGTPLSGYYFREARFLGTLRLEVNGEPPWLCEAATIDPETLALNYVHPEITEPGGGGTGQAGDEEGTDRHGIPERSLDFRLSLRVGVAGLGSRAGRRQSRTAPRRVRAGVADRRRLRRHPGSAIGQARAGRLGRSRPRTTIASSSRIGIRSCRSAHTSATTGAGAWRASG